MNCFGFQVLGQLLEVVSSLPDNQGGVERLRGLLGNTECGVEDLRDGLRKGLAMLEKATEVREQGILWLTNLKVKGLGGSDVGVSTTSNTVVW